MNGISNSKSQPLQVVPKKSSSLPAGIWILGLGSLCMDTSSELIHSLLPILMTAVLGASMVTVGVIEGVAEATAAITKIFSGALSDFWGKRKLPTVLGYTLAACTKPIFPLANSVGWIFSARFVDRIGKGIRGAPRDALVADIVPPELRGAAYGLRQALDSIGAFLGPLLALLFMALWADNLRSVMWIAVIPAFIAVLLLAAGIHEPESHGVRRIRNPLSLSDARKLSLGFWLVVLVGAVFALARFSEAFLVLRARDAGFSLGHLPLVMIVMNVVYAGVAYPAGAAADRFSRRALLICGLLLLIVADFLLAFAATPLWVLAGVAFWGLHMALTQGLLSKMVADAAPEELRATAFGLFSFVSGGALLMASIIAGSLWSALGASATFLAGALFAGIAVVGLLAYPRKVQQS